MKPLPIQSEVQRQRPSNAVRVARNPFPVYPVMLVASTLLAAVFCVLYLTKPVVNLTAAGPATDQTAPARVDDEAPAAPAQLAGKPADPEILPSTASLPGDPGTRVPGPQPAELAAELPQGNSATELEETNLKIQHVLSAEGPDGELARIVVDVPVLYQSRSLRWSANQVAEARALLDQLRTHQQQSRTLRAEGMLLLDAWQSLVARSIPSPALRADSPTLPANQPSEHAVPAPSGRDTAESIEVQTADSQ